MVIHDTKQKEASVGYYDMVEITASSSKRGFHTGMIVGKKYVNDDKPYYKKLGKMIVEMEMDKHLDTIVTGELMKFKDKKCDPTAVVKNVKAKIKRAKVIYGNVSKVR